MTSNTVGFVHTYKNINNPPSRVMYKFQFPDLHKGYIRPINFVSKFP